MRVRHRSPTQRHYHTTPGSLVSVAGRLDFPVALALCTVRVCTEMRRGARMRAVATVKEACDGRHLDGFLVIPHTVLEALFLLALLTCSTCSRATDGGGQSQIYVSM